MTGGELGHYRLLEQLGAGGMGVVYRAHDEQLDRDVAIKVLPGGSFAEPAARARLLREARSAAALNHPHICTIHEVGEAGGQAYIAMELVEGETLSTRLAGGPVPPEDVLRYGLQLTDALAHAHERGILHRDLKSANVVITPEGRAKVLDFGLAKHLSGNELDEVTRTQVSLTTPGALMGTLAYMAPEQLRGQPADARSDVWALGVVFYEAVAGSLPFQGRTGFEISSAILNQDPAPLLARVPLELQVVIGRCLQKDPARRYQRASEVRAALEAAQARTVTFGQLLRYRLARHRWTVLMAVLALLLIAAGLSLEKIRTRLLGRPLQIRSLAVLPLENLSGDPEQDAIADGIHAGLITDLAKLGCFERVIARPSVMAYKKTDRPLQLIAKELRVDAVMTGSFMRAGDRVQVAVQLVGAMNGENLWAGRYERKMQDVLALQNEILASLTQEMKLQLSPQSQAKLSRARTVNPEAYELYLRGTSLVNQLSPEGIDRGLRYLRRSTEIDPSDPLPYAGLAVAYSLVGHSADPEAYIKARVAAQKALELDDSLAEVHEALGMISLYQTWDWKAAERSFRRALELNPNLSGAHAHYGWYLQLMGRQEDGIVEEKRAAELDPLDPVLESWVGAMYWDAGRYEEAIAEAQKALELNPSFPWGFFVLGGAYAAQGKFDEAIDQNQKMAAVSPDGKWALGVTYAMAGRGKDARALAAGLRGNPASKAALGLSLIYAELGEKDEAFRWLNIMCDRRDAWAPWLSVPGGQWKSLDPLRDDPRFKAFLRRVNLPE